MSALAEKGKSVNWFYGKQLGNPLPDNRHKKGGSRMNMHAFREDNDEFNDDCRTLEPLKEQMCECPWQPDVAAYGAVYLCSDAVISVNLPGSAHPVAFNDAAQFFCGVKQQKDGIVIENGGRYEIKLTLMVAATSAAFATFLLKADNETLPGGKFSRILNNQMQSISESIVATLGAGAHVGIDATSATVLGLKLSGASLSVERID
jgi:hypothetical protein